MAIYLGKAHFQAQPGMPHSFEYRLVQAETWSEAKDKFTKWAQAEEAEYQKEFKEFKLLGAFITDTL